MTPSLTLAEALAEVERAQRELDEERTQRQKLEDDPAQPRHLVTETAVGYRLVA